MQTIVSLRRMLSVDCTQGWLYHILTSSAKEGSDGWILDDGWGDESLFVCSRFSPFGIEFEWEVLLTDSYVEVGGADGNAKVSRDLLLRERASTTAAAATCAALPPRFSAAFPLLQVPTSKCNSHENQLWLCVSLWHDLVPMTRIRVRVRVICVQGTTSL